MRIIVRLVMALTVLGLTASNVVAVPPPASATRFAPGKKSANLQQQLESGLRARRPEEFAFIDRVITMVKQGKLPETLVRSTFDWARDKRPYPYPFFERGLKVRAARLGIVVN